jgi:hypothetical protein
LSVSTDDGQTASVSCDAVAKRPAHISCRVSLSSTELASMMGRSNLGGTALADNPASRSRRSVFSTVLIQFFDSIDNPVGQPIYVER